MADHIPDFVLDDDAIPPQRMAGEGTLSIEIVPEHAVAAGEAYVAQAAITAAGAVWADLPPLPIEPKPTSRYGRRYRGEPARVARESYLPRLPGARPAPEGFWPELVYGLSLSLLNVGDSRDVRHRKQLDARIAAPLDGGARFVPVLSRHGGVGATTVTTLLGMALAVGRDDEVLAIDAHPDRGTLAERIGGTGMAGVRDVVRRGTLDRAIAQDDATGLSVLASSTDPLHEVPFGPEAYESVADLVEAQYAVVLTDGASGALEPVMQAALRRADGLVVVSGGTADQARLASETVSWLEENDYAELAENAVVAISTSTPGTRYESLDAIEAHFQARVRDVVRIPYDEELVSGEPVRYGALRPDTHDAARDLAALVVDGLVAPSTVPTGNAA
jgi:MinD-like ATPase involved in chromosome partitioning or flagellar assembly